MQDQVNGYRIPAMVREHEAILGRNNGMWRQTTDGDAIFYCYECGQPMSIPKEAIMASGKLNPDVVCPYILKEYAFPTIGCPKCEYHFDVTFLGFPMLSTQPVIASAAEGK